MPSFTITLTDAQANALQDATGVEGSAVGAQLQAYVTDWMTQFTRTHVERSSRELAEALLTAPSSTKAAVAAALKSHRDSKETPA